MQYIEIPPFTNILFKDRKTAEKLAPIITNVDRLISTVEIELVKRGIRECDIYHVYPETLYEDMKLVYENKLTFKVIDAVKRYTGFAHKHEKPTTAEETMYYGALCRSQQSAEEMVQAHRKADHDKIGELLGYPKCDRKFFIEHWGKGWLDLVYPTAVNTPGFTEEKGTGHVEYHPYTLTTIRYAGIRVIPYFSHSFTCQPSIKLGQTIIDIANEIDPQTTKQLIQLLTQEHTWTQYMGLIEVTTKDFKILAGGWTDKKLTLKLKPAKTV